MPTSKYALTLDAPFPVADYGSVTYTESVIHEYTLATASTDSSISFGMITTAALFYFKSDAVVTLELQSASGTALVLVASKPVFLAGCALTAAYVTNASGATANIVCVIAGA